MIQVNSFPASQKHFIKLKKFTSEILNLCNDLKVNPLLYGCLAYFAYTQNKKVRVNDIDFLIPEFFLIRSFQF